MNLSFDVECSHAAWGSELVKMDAYELARAVGRVEDDSALLASLAVYPGVQYPSTSPIFIDVVGRWNPTSDGPDGYISHDITLITPAARPDDRFDF